jgi:YfiH family protein
MNLGAHVGDEPVMVSSNRALLQAELSRRGAGELLFLNQVHGQQVLLTSTNIRVEEGATADGALSVSAGQSVCMMVADCLPVLLADRHGRLVGALHAGWRGLSGVSDRDAVGVIEAAVTACEAAMRGSGGWSASDLLAWLGPCIGAQAFEVGTEVRDAFCRNDFRASAFFCSIAPGKWLADLPGLARHRLKALGVSSVYGNDGTNAWCTYTQSALFFSHRRDAARLGSCGRMAACIALT